MNTENRDVACAAEVGRMAELGRFESEFHIYGCAYMENDAVTFRLSENGTEMYHFVRGSVSENRYPTSVQGLLKRTLVPAGMAETLVYEAKLDLARQLHQEYPRVFFETLANMAKAPNHCAAAPLLKKMAQAIEGHYDEMELQLFSALLERCYQGKQLDRYEHWRFEEWLRKVHRQMENDPVPGAQLKRTLYGFCYQAGEKIVAIYDAVETTILERHTEKILEGRERCGPVLRRTYWLDNFGEMAAVRKQFKTLLLQKENAALFSFMEVLDQLPAAVDAAPFHSALSALEAQGAQRAVADLRRYGRLWNVE